ncbi:peptidase family C54 [Ancylostoma duodenale]|uniref:Cysteine protease n=1 Tax=Ancylostoma duodenale TaxID=51022 RepID=A0A0C2GPN6_9BILA|nr:peptidase family C54 [Ancylostoma duodenale]
MVYTLRQAESIRQCLPWKDRVAHHRDQVCPILMSFLVRVAARPPKKAFQKAEKWMHFANDDYSSDGFKRIVLLGLSYCPEDSECDCGMDFIDFYRDYYTRIWITYRTGMPAFSGTKVTSDCGWGCMIRTTQMALAQALVVNRMTRRWRYYARKHSQRNGLGHHDPFYDAQIEVLKLFEDCPSAPLGIHRLVEISSTDDPSKNAVGRWYAPSEVISLMKRALRQSASPLTSDLSLMLAVDGRVIVGDAERESRAWAKRLLLFVPLRLGTSSVNPVYHDHIRRMLSLETCLGILGGKPDHSLYFIGYYGRDCPSAPLGIHRLVEISSADDPSKNAVGRWYAPSEVISLMKRALRQSASPLTSDLSLMLAVDGRVIVGDAERESRAWAKRLLLFVPLRLGTSSVNPVYHDHIRHMLSLGTCLGILGGKPDHSLYFIGYYGRNVIYLDPHVAHEYIPMSSWGESSTTMDGVAEGHKEKRHKNPLSAYHCRSLSKMPMKEMDPSCVVGFMFRTKEELDETFRILNLHQVVDVDLGPGEGSKRTRDPLFTVQYQETAEFDYIGVASEEERQQALEHGFELL